MAASTSAELTPSTVERSDTPDGLVLHFRGEIDLAVDQMSQPRVLLPRSTRGDVLVDLTDVTFIDSSGINLLLKLKMRADEIGVRMSVVNASSRVIATLRVCGLLDHLHVAAN